MATPFDTLLEMLNTLMSASGETQTEQPYQTPDMVQVITQAMGDIDLIGAIQNMVGQVTGASIEGAIPEEVAAGNPPVEGGGGGGQQPVQRTHKRTMEHLARAGSLPVVDTDLLLSNLTPHILGHMGITSALGIIAMVAEALSIGQVDGMLNDLHSLYGLLDTPVIYSQIRDERLAVEWRRPYRYYVESVLQNNIPPTSDLITFLVREVISIDEFKRVMSYQGFSEDVSQMYWDSHFIMPSTQEVYDMEALGMITEEEGKAQLVINDISPLWVDKIWELRKRLPSRTELRLMLRRQKMPDELIERTFRFERLHPDFAEHFKFMLLNWDIDSIYGRIINEAIGHYQDGLINEEALRLLCTDHLASDAEVDAYTVLAKMRQDERRREEQKNMWVALFKKNYQEREAVTSALLTLNFNEIDIGIWLDKAEVDSLPKLTIEQQEYEEEQEGET